MAASDCSLLLGRHPCAQCGKPIASPLWSERERNRVSFLWSCQVCDYQFVTIAVLKSQDAVVHVPQETPVRHDGSAIAA
jgi:ribosomal protein L37AE/L43A